MTAPRTRLREPTADLVLPPSLARSAYEEKYIGMFWNFWLPCGELSPECSSQYPISRWTSDARDMYRQDNALRGTFLAMCLSAVGQRDDQEWLVADGLQLYVKALSELNAGLRHPKRWRTDALLMASRGLGLFEAIAACMSRKRTFLSDLQWKTIPWSETPKSAKDVLIDILVDVPVLLEQADLLQRAHQPALKMCRRFMETYRRLDRELRWWLENLSPESRWLDDLTVRSFKHPTGDDIALAHVMTLFWTTCILVYSSLNMVLYTSPASFASETFQPIDCTDLRQYCTRIADTVEVFFQSEAGLVGMHAAPFPTGTAIKYLMFTEGIGSDDCRKLIGYFKRQNGGAAMGRFLTTSLQEWDKVEPPSFENTMN
ncbi:hypothetical protein CCHL11_02814 [Colletotrichum chlorophyti]|uniref:Uncharacterized protein n=1 Tax=Colletotrichum chlorophyti TaxID=708187 RepID=A0A1Q8S122_9PEZI|nr:hypothetical protein CCHL11_02814 [Colletotrichum chlorophyti]